ncbi:MAG: helix-turn-helix domain-containing protein [Coleofasciculaceae cyanobacterium]
MVFQPADGNSFIDNSTIEISHEGLRSLLRQIEAELINSEVYRRTMAGLETILGEASQTGQILVKAVGKEAIKLTFQNFIRQYNIVPVTAEGKNTKNETNKEKVDSSQVEENNQTGAESTPDQTYSSATPNFSELLNSSQATKSTSSNRKRIDSTKANQKSLSKHKEEKKEEELAQERQEILRQIGQKLRQARQAKLLSLEQLYRQTMVPIHQIEALENSRLASLPEDIYVRGFIRQIANALGLKGTELAASLPQPNLKKSVIPSWYRDSSPASGVQLSSVHLYLGYTALIAGAIGGLSWMSNQPTAGNSSEIEPDIAVPPSLAPQTEHTESNNKPGLQSNNNRIKTGADIAPPESLPF